jgi:multicomponent K+:H+ antiporter subunit A
MLAALLSIPFLGALLFVLLPRNSTSLPRTIALAITGAALLVLGSLTMQWTPGGAIVFSREWIPEIGLAFSVWLDGPALFWAWLVLGIGFLVFWYSGYYMDPKDSPWRFYGMLVIFMGSMLGLVTAKNVLLMFVFWELTSVTSFVLIGHWNHKESAREGATRALLVTGSGGLCLLAGVAAMYAILKSSGIEGGFEWDVLWANREVITGHPLAPWVLALLLIGAFTKSAQFPFHYWLPGAMEAPTPVSAYLHAATMVKAGIYLLGRIYPIFGDMTLWLAFVATTGVLTMLIGGYMAIMARDLKQLLAFSTVSQLGLLTAYYGFGYARLTNGDAHHGDGHDFMLKMDLLLVASHAFFKGGLFMLVGIIDHGTHTRDWTRLGGLWKAMPFTAILTTFGCLSMAGVPFTLGYTAKELFIEAGLYLETYDIAVWQSLVWIAVVASMFTVAYCMRMVISTFLGRPRDHSIHPHEASWGLLAAPMILISLCVAGGIYLPFIEIPISKLVNPGFYETSAYFKLTDTKKAISLLLFLAGGPLVFFASGWIEKGYAALGKPTPWQNLYNAFFNQFVPWIAKWNGEIVQSVSLRRNVLILSVVSLLLIAAAMGFHNFHPERFVQPEHINLLGFVALVMIMISLGVVLRARDPIQRITAQSIVGVLVGLYFVIYYAPDVAMTQILVELASLAILLLLLPRLRKVEKFRPAGPVGVLIPGVVSIALGLVMGMLTYLAATSELRHEPILPGNPTHGEFYLANSKYPTEAGARSGGGKNVVNVILVDFRGIDTMGEITVLGLAAMGVFCLIRVRRSRMSIRDTFSPEMGDRAGLGHKPDDRVTATSKTIEKLGARNFPLLEPISYPVTVLMLSFAAVLFFAGHNAPGGGFIAGLMASVAFLPYYLTRHKSSGEPLGVPDAFPLLALGILLAVGTGVVATIMGAPFLTSGFFYVDIPLIHHVFGSTGFASAAAFDAGVFCLVLGSTLLVLRTFGRSN